MSQKVSQYSRIINHRLSTSGRAFTIPTSNDHTDETWLASDLYVGELGINITDDTIFMRTNNGIIQISASSSASSGSNNLWNWSSPNIEIGSSYSADAVTPRSGVYTNLGSSGLRWKDLYLGGQANGYSTINVSTALSIKDSGGIINTNNHSSDNSPIVIGSTGSSIDKDRGIFINTYSSTINGTGNERAIIGSRGVSMLGNNNNVVLIGASSVAVASGVTSSTHIGYGYGKTNSNSLMVTVGNLGVRGVSDDGSGQYLNSDWKTTQTRLRTSDALSTTLVHIPNETDGDLLTLKAVITATTINNPTQVYTAELFGTSYTSTSYSNYVLPTPIINETNSFDETFQAEILADATGTYIKVVGSGTLVVQWLCSYSYHKLVNVKNEIAVPT